MAHDVDPPSQPDGEAPIHLPPEAISGWILSPAETNESRLAKHRLVQAIREAIALVILDVAESDAAAITAEVDGLTEAVGALTQRISALPTLSKGTGMAGGDDARLLERSPMSGRSNPVAPPLHLSREEDRVVGWATYSYQYEGPPGCVHGGCVAAAFDDLLGAAQTLSGMAGFTGTLSVRMVLPTPLHRRIDYEGGVTSVEGRKILTWGKASHAGDVVAEATGLFIAPRAGTSYDLTARGGTGAG